MSETPEPQDELDKAIGWLSKLRAKVLIVIGALATALWTVVVQWLSPQIAALTPRAKLGLQLLGASFVLNALLAISWLILLCKNRQLQKKKSYPIICGLKWNEDGQPLCPNCENPVYEADAACMTMGCAFCNKSFPASEHGHNVSIGHAVRVARERLKLPTL